MTEKNMHYGIQAKWYGFQKIGIYNGNTFELNNLDVLILKEQKCYSYHINTIAAHSEWIENGIRHGFLTDITAKNSAHTQKISLSYMSTHPRQYKKLADSPENLEMYGIKVT